MRRLARLFGPAKLERAQLGLVSALAATCLVSIFAAEILLALAALVYLVRLALRHGRLGRLPLDGPILAFAVWTLLSASFSPAPVLSYESTKKLLLVVVFYLAADTLVNTAARERVLDATLLGGLALAVGSLLQYYFLGFDTLNNRPRSFLGHYMTASGLVMGTTVLAAARLAFRAAPAAGLERRDLLLPAALVGGIATVTTLHALDLFGTLAERLFVAGLAVTAGVLALARGPWPGPAAGRVLASLMLGAGAWAIVLSRTRSAWLGLLVGIGLLAALRAPRTLWLLPAAIATVLILRPAPVIERLTIRDASSRDRYFMWQAGVDMVLDKPVFGQGPRMVEVEYPAYRWPGAPNPATPHLHNNALQIAAERGIPCLAWWLWWMAAAMADAWRESRTGRTGRSWVACAALAFLAALMAAGLFEYNFGDSEVLMLALLVSALPYALRRERLAAA